VLAHPVRGVESDPARPTQRIIHSRINHGRRRRRRCHPRRQAARDAAGGVPEGRHGHTAPVGGDPRPPHGGLGRQRAHAANVCGAHRSLQQRARPAAPRGARGHADGLGGNSGGCVGVHASGWVGGWVGGLVGGCLLAPSPVFLFFEKKTRLYVYPLWDPGRPLISVATHQFDVA
jgi:hypothetical protein